MGDRAGGGDPTPAREKKNAQHTYNYLQLFGILGSDINTIFCSLYIEDSSSKLVPVLDASRGAV